MVSHAPHTAVELWRHDFLAAEDSLRKGPLASLESEGGIEGVTQTDSAPGGCGGHGGDGAVRRLRAALSGFRRGKLGSRDPTAF